MATHRDYEVGWICALPKEQTAAIAMLDDELSRLAKKPQDPNFYTLGRMNGQNVVITCLPKGLIGTAQASSTPTWLSSSFPNLRYVLMVGIGGGIPGKVKLGDVVVGTPTGPYPGVVQWDLGKAEAAGFKRTGALSLSPTGLLCAVAALEDSYERHPSQIPDHLLAMATKWPSLVEYQRPRSVEGGADDGQTRVHLGLIASGNKVVKDTKVREDIERDLGGHVLCIEMEAGGIVNVLPCLVIRGICEYADGDKNDVWQKHAAAVAAAYAKEVLGSCNLATIAPHAWKDDQTALRCLASH